jgi:SAM-dependent methyltransferase
MTERVRATVFGEVADSYDDVRAGYPAELVDMVLDYLGRPPSRVVEVGAGTGKATEAFAARDLPIVCVEPDPLMATVLRRRFVGLPRVVVVPSRFEDWVPPAGGIDLLYAAQAWHWVEPETRWQRAHAAVRSGGVVAIFGHGYLFVDQAMQDAIHATYADLAPELLNAGTEQPTPEEVWFTVELRGSGLFEDLRAVGFKNIVAYPTDRYLALLSTFSNHRMVAEERRATVHGAVAEVIDARGGVVELQLDTLLAVGRRV